MVRIARISFLTALLTAVVTGLWPAPAQAEPQPGSITAIITDVCGFVKADFANADPVVSAHIRFSRNGRLFEGWSEFVGSGMSATVHEVAAGGDVIRFEWDVEGGTESLEHTHVTPPGCDEPKLSLSLADGCGLYFTVVITNSGTGPGDVLLSAPTMFEKPYTVPAGGVVKVTVPGAATSSARLFRVNPAPPDPFQNRLIVDEIGRAPGCGIPWPEEATAFWAPACKQVTVVFFAVHMKGLVQVYRNGKVVVQETTDNRVHRWIIAVKPGDRITILDPPVASYTHKPPGCAVAAPPAPPRAAVRPASSAAPPVAPAVVSPTPPESAAPSASASEPVITSEPPVQPPARTGVPVAAMATGAALTTVAAGLGAWFLIGLVRRRRRPVWAVAFGTLSAQPAVRDIGFIPTVSVRWVAHPGPITQFLREDAS
jgi:hypothetical protein